jgi:uncharacterized ferritin-like protein (DUF455 family)
LTLRFVLSVFEQTEISMPESVRSFCLALLQSPTLEEKLRAPVREDGSRLLDDAPGPPVYVDSPARCDAILLQKGSDRLPKLRELSDPHARAICLERFAHHELCAVELFAWALLAFPETPPAFRRGLLQALGEEQLHLRLYLERLTALNHVFGSQPLSDYLWQHPARILASPNPPAAFLCAMGLTFEQANLDYSLLYRDAFRQAGDEPSAQVLQKVHDDEIRHVKLAAHWLRVLAPHPADDVGRYMTHTPFPLSPVRAKARRFDVAARRRAGLSEELIRFVRDARPSHQPREAGKR